MNRCLLHGVASLLLLGPTAGAQPPWAEMDYGPFLSAAIQVDGAGDIVGDIVGKGIAVRLNGPRGEAMLFDTDTLRWACGWHGDFVALRGIVYDGPHGTFPRIDGVVDWRNPPGAGVSIGTTFDDPRDGAYGPLPAAIGAWRGVSLHGDDVAMAYRVGDTEVLDAPSYDAAAGGAYVRTIEWHGGRATVRLAVTDGPSTRERPVTAVGDGRLVGVGGGNRLAIELPPVAGTGWVQIRIGPGATVASTGAGDEAAAAGTRPTLDRFRAGGPPRWTDTPVLAGRLGVRFDEDADVRVIVRTPGAPSKRLVLDGAHPDDATAMLTLGGAAIEAGEAEAEADATRTVLVTAPRIQDAPSPRAAFDFDEGQGVRMRDAVTGERTLRLDGATWRRGVGGRGRALDFDGTARATWEGGDLDPTAGDFTVAAWIHTDKDGTIVSRTRPSGDWVPQGWTFFVRGGRLAFDVGWVGVVAGKTRVTDAGWHHVAATWARDGGRVRLYVDGALDAAGALPPEGPVDDAVVQLGFTAPNFPGDPWFSGFIDGVRLYDSVLDRRAIRAAAAASGEPIVTAWGLRGALPGARWVPGDAGAGPALEMPAATAAARAELVAWHGLRSRLPEFVDTLDGPASAPPFEIDAITWPAENAYGSWMRFGAFDFLPGDGTAAAISTWSGDVWRVDGLDADLDRLRWQRIATGLHQPLGLVVRGDDVLVLARDQITRLDDLNGDGETDRYACFNHDHMNTEHFHEPCTGLQVGPDGALYYVKAARHAKRATHPQHGTLIRVAPDGSTSTIIASGFRAPCGLHVDADGTAFASDQEGHWTPANRINAIVPGGFYGNNWSGTGTPRDDYDPPLCWIHPSVDRSPSAQLRVVSPAWGDLDGALLGLSYGTGRVYRILEDEVGGVRQGGIVPLPIEVPTGLMTGRFNPADGHLYLCGLFGWSSDKTEPGGFYRVRKTARTPLMVEHVRATRDGLTLRFNRPIAPRSLHEPEAFGVTAWNYAWSERYGSPQIRLDGNGQGVTRWAVDGADVGPDGRTVRLRISAIEPAMQVHVRYIVHGTDNEPAVSYAYLTIHALHDGAFDP